MTTILLPPDIERPLVEAALRLGTTPEQLAVETLRERFATEIDEPSSGAATLFDPLVGYIGTVDGSTEAYSERCGERFAEGLADAESRRSQ